MMRKLIAIPVALMVLAACQKQDSEQSGPVDTTLPDESQTTQPELDNASIASLRSDSLEGEPEPSPTDTSDDSLVEGDPEGLDFMARRARMAEDGQDQVDASQTGEARGNPGSWVTTDDYPPSAIRNQEQGTSALAFDVDASGRIENCRVTSTSGSTTLEAVMDLEAGLIHPLSNEYLPQAVSV